MRLTALVAALSLATVSLGGCKFGVEHPAPFIGITAGLIAEGTCAIQVEGDQLKCVEIAGAVGIGLGAIVALAMLLGGEGDTVLRGPDEEAPLEPLQQEPPDAPATNPDAVKPVVPATATPDPTSAPATPTTEPAPAPTPDAGSASPAP